MEVTILVSLLFIAMIPVDCKITLHLFVYFFCNNYNMYELTSTTSRDRITTNIIFVGATPINQQKGHIRVSFLCWLALLHSVIDREEHEKYFFLEIWKIHLLQHTHSQDQLITVKGQFHFVFRVVQHFYRTFKNRFIVC